LNHRAISLFVDSICLIVSGSDLVFLFFLLYDSAASGVESLLKSVLCLWRFRNLGQVQVSLFAYFQGVPNSANLCGDSNLQDRCSIIIRRLQMQRFGDSLLSYTFQGVSVVI